MTTTLQECASAGNKTNDYRVQPILVVVGDGADDGWLLLFVVVDLLVDIVCRSLLVSHC